MLDSSIMGGSSMDVSSYKIHNFQVFFGSQYVPDARWSDFVDLGHGYGKDINNVFFMGHIIQNAHSFSFQVINSNYAKDYQYVFCYGQIVPALQPQCFQSPNNPNNRSVSMQSMQMNSSTSMAPNEISTRISSYEIRDLKVFFNNQYLSDARWIDFTDLGQGYGKDGHNVFFMGQLIRPAHAFSFEVLRQGCAKDKNYVFQNGQILQGIRSIDFKSP